MTHFLIRGAILGVIGGGLASCASAPTYPIASGAAPVSRPATSPPPSPPPAEAPPPPAPAPEPMAQPAPSPGSVQSQSLPPAAPPRDNTPASAAPPAVESAAPPPPAPAVFQAEPPRREAGRYIAAGKVVEAQKMYRDYVVAKGDHLDAIARDLQTTRAILVDTNHLKKPDSLVPGQHLKVPIEKAYVVQSGDTLAAVAKRFDVSVEDLADLNAMPEHQRLRSGDELALPGVIHDNGPVLVASVARLSPRYMPPGRYTPPSGAYRPSPWAVAAGQGQGGGSSLRPPQPYPTTTTPAAPSLSDAQVTAAGRGRFVWPVRGEILSPFGIKDVGRRNDGVDVKAAQGTPVHAAAAGDVVYAGDQVPGFGNLVLVKHADGWVTAYAHLDKVDVKMRETVTQDQEIGQVGESGGVSEPQLHFEIRYAPTPMEKAKPIDPLLVLPQ